MSSMNRRAFAKLAVAIGATAAWGDLFGEPSRTAWRERRESFPEGIASGDPDSSSVLLWTRCPQAEKSSAAEVRVEVSEDQSFRHVVARAITTVSASSDWTSRVLVGGLQPRSSTAHRRRAGMERRRHRRQSGSSGDGAGSLPAQAAYRDAVGDRSGLGVACGWRLLATSYQLLSTKSLVSSETIPSTSMSRK